MSELERLIEIARDLPPSKVHALLTVAEQMTDGVSEEEFLLKINSAAPLDVDKPPRNFVPLFPCAAKRSTTKT